MRRATVYLRKKQFLIHASSRTTDGVWILWQPCVAIAEQSDDRTLGAAVRDALAGSRTEVAHPQAWSNLLQPLLTLAGVKSWSMFAKNAVCVEVEDDGAQVRVIPTHNLGVEQGFAADPERQVMLGGQAIEALGAAVRRLSLVSPSGKPGSVSPC